MYCEKHGEYESESIEIFGRTVSTGCPKCSEDIDEANEKVEREKEERKKIARLEAMNIEAMYFDATLPGLDIASDELQKAIAYAEKMIIEKAGKLILLGAHGTGKTHIAVSVVKAIGGAIYSMYEITTRIRASYVHGAHETELQIVEELSRLRMLAIDEIGRTKGSEAETNWLSYIIDKRHARNLPLILISNKHLRKTCPSKGCDKCLENYISEDIMSRLNEDGHLVILTGDDYRKTKRRA